MAASAQMPPPSKCITSMAQPTIRMPAAAPPQPMGNVSYPELRCIEIRRDDDDDERIGSVSTGSPKAPRRPPPPPRRSPPPPPPSASPAVAAAYLSQLATFAVELERDARDLTALRLLRQRLQQWAEDVASTGANDLAAEVEWLVVRLSTVIETAGLMSELREIARELALLAASGGPPPVPTRRAEFWK
jgi:hypothetical protein